jgi:hypothetical protein
MIVVSQQMKRAMNDQPDNFFGRRGLKTACVPEGLRHTNVNVRRLVLRSGGRGILVTKSNHVGGSLFLEKPPIETANTGIIYEDHIEFAGPAGPLGGEHTMKKAGK